MPRPRKCKMICFLPETLEFMPRGECRSKEPVRMTVDEYETIRLIDKEGLSQEECAERMEVARTTVQQIYASARKKLADVLVDGLSLKIQGGEYKVCGEATARCSYGGCRKRGRRINPEKELTKGEEAE